uniref:Hypothetical secreted protein SST7 n=1 Tax=Mus musculus TaxID=10090 RepID=Q810H1_MOUSE|nr:hypothetical secreted protein SST7 [Mus musculus]
MEVFLLLLTRLCLLTHLEGHPASFKTFKQPEQVRRASPPANIHLVMTALAPLSCHYQETSSYLVPRVVLHMPSKKSFSPQCQFPGIGPLCMTISVSELSQGSMR